MRILTPVKNQKELDYCIRLMAELEISGSATLTTIPISGEGTNAVFVYSRDGETCFITGKLTPGNKEFTAGMYWAYLSGNDVEIVTVDELKPMLQLLLL